MLSMLKNWLNSTTSAKHKEPEAMEDEPSTLPTIVISRFKFTDQGTLGVVLDSNGDSFLDLVTIELPWRNNRRMLSCIPRGSYTCSKVKSPRFGDSYQVTNVEGRSHVLFHHGNFAGDTFKGYRADSNGCILLGMRHGNLQNQDAVLSSRMARTLFESTMEFQPFKLIIRESV